MKKQNPKTYAARLKRAADLFMADGDRERASRALSLLYLETDSIDDLFLLVDLLRQMGRYETVISLLDERKNEDDRVWTMLRGDLAAYAALLRTGSQGDSSESSIRKNEEPGSGTDVETSEPPVKDKSAIEDLEEGLSSAFTKLRKKK